MMKCRVITTHVEYDGDALHIVLTVLTLKHCYNSIYYLLSWPISSSFEKTTKRYHMINIFAKSASGVLFR